MTSPSRYNICPLCNKENVISGTEENSKFLHSVCLTEGCSFDIIESLFTRETWQKTEEVSC